MRRSRPLPGRASPSPRVFDPFAGLMTVPLRAVLLDRRGYGVELSPQYFADGVRYLQEAEEHCAIPTLFEALESEAVPQ